MKNLTICTIVAAFLLSFIPMPAKASTGTNTIPMTSTVVPADSTALIARLDEIYAMDKSSLSPSEKRELRKEVRATKKQLKHIGGGVYVSAGALILIVVLIVILL